MKSLLHKLRMVLDRGTKFGLIYATAGSAVIAAFDMLAIALVLPLVDLAAGTGKDHPAIQLISGIAGTTDTTTLTVIVAILVVALFIMKDALSIAFVWWMAGFKAFNRVETSTALLNYYLKAPYTQMSARSSADLMRTMSDGVAQVYGSVAFSLMNMVSGSLAIGAIVIALLVSAPVPTVALLVYLGLASVLYLRLMRPKMQQAGAASAQAAADAWRGALGALGGRKESRLRSSEDFFAGKYREAASRGARAGRHAEFVGSLPRYVLEILFIAAIGVILVTNTLGSSGSGPAGGIGMLALFVAAGFRVLPTITMFVGAVSSLRFGLPYLDLVYEDMLAARSVPPSRVSGNKLPLAREVRVEHVSFTYPGSDRKVLDDVSLGIPAGSSLALVGGSGAGKTTLVDLILGLHKPDEGRLAIDGIDVATNLSGWQRNVGYVPQDVFLMEASLAENIAFDQHREDIDLARLERCIDRAQLRSLIAELPDGVDTHLGERGSRLSGGQRQRVGIARALYREPAVLVLDEATSALDNETEHSISTAMHKLRGSLTLVIVAHRLSTVKNADQVVLLDEGRVVASGAFNELRQRSEQFERLVQLGSLED